MILSKEFILRKVANIILHSIFWVITLFSYTYFFGYDTDNINYAFSFSLFLMPVTIGTTYVAIDMLIPKYLLQEKYVTFIVYCIYTIIISAFFIIISFFYGLIFLSSLQFEGMAPLTRSPLFLFVAVYFVVFVASAFRLIQYNYTSIHANQELKTKILETQLKLKEQELQHLKMQIHPHFLFNTLNTIYGLAIKKSENTPDMILKLSNLLDYLLYQTDKTSVSLQDEIDHIQDYLALEKMRFSDTLNLKTDISQINDSMQIAPMLFIPFVENSFKHGQIRNKKLSVKISIKCVEKDIHFSIKNSIISNQKKDGQGIGLGNIQKRLELLYKNKHQLTIAEDQDWYSTNLIINT